jgi:hypothetical protein
MLTKKFDFTIAEYTTLEEVTPNELAQADWITIQGQVPGGIYHAKTMRWKANLAGLSTPTDLIKSKTEKKEIAHNRQYFEDHGYRFSVDQITPQLFTQFQDLYLHTTAEKERLRKINLYDQIMAKADSDFPTYLIGMYQGQELASALVFFLKENEAKVSVGAKKKFTHVRGGVGGVLEVELLKFCGEHQITSISHGQSPNPAGVIGSAGIFEFKARYGFTAYPEDNWFTSFFPRPEIALSDMVFVTILDGKLGYLIVSNTKESEVINKYKCRDIQNVKIITTAELQANANHFISQQEHLTL